MGDSSTQTGEPTTAESKPVQSATDGSYMEANMVDRTESSTGDKKEGTILVLINPHSGKGKSVSIYKKKILPFLNSHNIEHQAFISEADLRVSSYLRDKSLPELLNLRSILVVSGDGLFHEAVNALMSREDWQQAISVPIGVVPTGSGNGLAYTLIRQRHPEVSDPETAINICCELAILDETCLADLVKITINPESPNSRTVWSFLSLGWGLLADIDIDSEWLRCLGEFRFTIYGLLRALTSISYKGKLSYKVANPEKGPNGAKEMQQPIEGRTGESEPTEEADSSLKQPGSSADVSIDEWVHIEDKFACLYAVYQSYVSSVTKFAPKSTLTDQLIYLTFIRGKLSPCQVVEFLLAIKDGSHENLDYCTVVPVEGFDFQPLEQSKVVVDGEAIPWNLSDGPIKAEVVPKVLKLLTNPSQE